jgi:hypothetical protein
MSDKKTMPYANLISFVFYSESPVDDVRKLQEFAAEDPNSLDSLETVARIASFAAYKAVKNDEVPQEIIGSCDGGSVSISTIVRPFMYKCDDCGNTTNDLPVVLADVPNLHERLSPGSEVPAGACSCGALMYIHSSSASF